MIPLAINSDQALLLRCALEIDEEAPFLAGSLNRFDFGSSCLLPLLFKTLEKRGKGAGRNHERLKGIYRYHWAKNRLLIESVSTALDTLSTQGIPWLLIKGAALAAAYYPALGSRILSDIDILVRPEAIGLACRCLKHAGWRPVRLRGTCAGGGGNFVSLRGPAREVLNVHAHLFREAWLRARPAWIWEGCGQAALGHLEARILPPEMQLLHTCCYGVYANHQPPLVWIADACLIARRSSSIILWETLMQRAATEGMLFPLARMLSFVFAATGLTYPQPEERTTPGNDWRGKLAHCGKLARSILAHAVFEGRYMLHTRLRQRGDAFGQCPF